MRCGHPIDQQVVRRAVVSLDRLHAVGCGDGLGHYATPTAPHVAEVPGQVAQIPVGTRRHGVFETVPGDDGDELDGVGAEVCVRVVGEFGRRRCGGVGHVDDRTLAGPDATVPANLNTVQLGRLEKDYRRPVVGLGPVAVVSSLDVPLGHLAFDETWVRASAAFRVEPPGEHLDDVVPESVRVVRG